MLQSIHIKNMALIDEAEICLEDGLNILTGETGAGKSMVIDSVLMALGGRAGRDVIRHGSDYALVELDFYVKDPQIKRRLTEMDLPPEEDHLVITRRISGQRSISRINGETVNLTSVRQAAALLIDIHGQYEHQSLLHKGRHLEIIDEFAGQKVKDKKKEIARAFSRWQTLIAEEEELKSHGPSREKEIDFLTFEISEIDAAALKEGEEEELDKKFRLMNNSREILENLSSVHDMMGYDGDSSAGSLNSRAIRLLDQVTRYDETISGFSSQLKDIDSLLGDFNHDLADYMDSLQFDEEEYRRTEERLERIARMKSKYGNTAAEILAYRDKCERDLEKLKNFEEAGARLERDLKASQDELDRLCGELSEMRRAQADILEKKISGELKELNFPDVRFEIRDRRLEQYTANGRDDFEFMISTNPGEDIRPLGKVASGGELSRIMLAIKSVLADTDSIDTLIFDEIDAGISGRTAQKVSERMAKIAGRHQVICITHLPQIASMADSHLLIEKVVESGRAVTRVRALKGEETVHEIARLLGGVRITDAVLENAREMKELAAERKKIVRGNTIE